MGQTIGQLYITCAWLEAIFYGVNCMLFGFCIQVLTPRSTSSHRVLAAAILQFSLSTAHVIISLVQLLQAFSVGNNPDAYYSHRGTLYIVGFFVYVINTLVQELLLIWRLYCLWGSKLKACIIPLVIWTVHAFIGLLAVASFLPTTVTGKAHKVVGLGLAAWGLETATNLAANFGIAYRLWKGERATSSLGKQRRLNYQSTLLLIAECGALITTVTVVMFGLFASGHEAGIAGVGIAAQVATISPLIIVVRVGRANRRASQRITSASLESSVLRTQNTYSDRTPQVGKVSSQSNSVQNGPISNDEEMGRIKIQVL